MELSLFDIIVSPVISNKAYNLHQNLKKIVLQVHVEANKPLVREAVRKLFNVEVESVRILVRKGKRKISRSRNVSFDALKKIAIVTLKNNSDINLFGGIVPHTQNQETQHGKSGVISQAKG